MKNNNSLTFVHKKPKNSLSFSSLIWSMLAQTTNNALSKQMHRTKQVKIFWSSDNKSFSIKTSPSTGIVLTVEQAKEHDEAEELPMLQSCYLYIWNWLLQRNCFSFSPITTFTCNLAAIRRLSLNVWVEIKDGLSLKTFSFPFIWLANKWHFCNECVEFQSRSQKEKGDGDLIAVIK